MTDEKLRMACVIGDPVAQSRSPLIHGYWLRKHGIAGDYRRELVKGADLKAFLADMPRRGYVGCNVTMPHKLAVMALSQPDARAKAIGAANAMWFDKAGVLRSTNTDVLGILGNLDAATPGWDKGLADAVVFGAGGAGRAAVYGLVERKIPRIRLVNRTLTKAEEFRQRFGPSVLPAAWEDRQRALAGAGLVLNATSCGMAGNPELDIDLAPVRDDCVVNDIVYVPLVTGLLAKAERRGLRIADGLGMLLHQAVYGFELWYGIRPAVTPELRQIIVDELLKKK
ncbi:MAG: shikimate dehydrogenase [Alphaproteobacteria bacterium]|nr:shikimate dehydrogenase [Alphaproteobacteria bacterium]